MLYRVQGKKSRDDLFLKILDCRCARLFQLRAHNRPPAPPACARIALGVPRPGSPAAALPPLSELQVRKLYANAIHADTEGAEKD